MEKIVPTFEEHVALLEAQAAYKSWFDSTGFTTPSWKAILSLRMATEVTDMMVDGLGEVKKDDFWYVANEITKSPGDVSYGSNVLNNIEEVETDLKEMFSRFGVTVEEDEQYATEKRLEWNKWNDPALSLPQD